MRKWIRRFALAASAGLLLLVPGIRAATVWEGDWGNRLEESKTAWVLELPDGEGELAGSLRTGGASFAAKIRREGAWLEVVWTDAEGRITQARGVIAEGEWRGLAISGGGGRLVEYGRFALRRVPADVTAAKRP